MNNAITKRITADIDEAIVRLEKKEDEIDDIAESNELMSMINQLKSCKRGIEHFDDKGEGYEINLIACLNNASELLVQI